MPESSKSVLQLIIAALNPPLLAAGAAALVFSGVCVMLLRCSKAGRGLLERVEDSGKIIPRAAAVLCVVYFLVYSYLSIHRYHKLLCWSWDLGIFESLLANVLDGRFFVDYRGKFDHLDLALVFYLPFYALRRDPRVLLVVQTAALALAGWPLYLLAKEVTGRASRAGALVIVYLLYPMLGAGNLHDFHSVSLTPLFFFSALYFMRRGRWRWYWVFIVLLLCVKETEAILVLAAGLYLLSRKDFARGGVTVVLALAWVTAALYLAIPAIMGEEYRHFSFFGGLTETAAWVLPAEPGRAVLARRIAQSTAVLFFALVPVAFIPARRLRPLLFIFMPVTGIYLLANNWNLTTIVGHYGLPVTAAALGAAALALRPKEPGAETRRPALLAFFLLTALCCNLLFSYPAQRRWAYTSVQFKIRNSLNILSMPLPVTTERRGFYTLSPHERFFHAARICIPRGSSVTAQRNLGTFFATGYELKDLFSGLPGDYYLIDLAEGYGTNTENYLAAAVELVAEEGIVRFLDTSSPGSPGFVFFARGGKWREFYSEAKALYAQEPGDEYRRAVVETVERTAGLGVAAPPDESAAIPDAR
ncbi:MAG: DUF2079 domain-containing protein [Planctomycetota bacterium]|jgi:hypothetical protein